MRWRAHSTASMANSWRRAAGAALGMLLVGCATPPIPPDHLAPARDVDGRIHRSRTAVAAFKAAHPCPATGRTGGACPGYIIDHIIPLACGSADAPDNMQYQTTEEAKAKDRWERSICR